MISGMEYLCYSQPLPVSDATRWGCRYRIIPLTSFSPWPRRAGRKVMVGQNQYSQPAAVDAGSPSVDGG